MQHCLNHVTCNHSWVKLKFYFAKFQCLYFVQYYVHLCNNKKRGRGCPTFMILYIMDQVYSACVIQCTIHIFHHYYKSEIQNLEMTTFQLSNTHSIFVSLRMIILFYGEYIVHLHCQWERRVIHTKIVYTCFTRVCIYGIAYFPFHSVFHSVPFSVSRFSNFLYQGGSYG